MRLLFYINSLYGGGAERVIANLANQFYQHGHNVCVVTTFKKNTEYYLDHGIERIVLTSIDEKLGNVVCKNIKLIKRLNRVIEKFDPLVAISFMGEPNFRLLACRTLKKKIISIRSDPRSEYRGIRGFITKKLFYKADGIVCQTQDVLNWLKPSIKKNGKVILNQVNTSFYKTDHLSFEYYVATGRLNEAKNYEMLIDAFHKFLKIHPSAKLHIYGEGELKQKLQDRIVQNGNENSIILKGRTDNINNVLSHAKAFLLSSNYEGMPNGLLEAMAVGVPCISTDCPCGGPRTVITNGINGILVPVGDVDSMVIALCKVEEDTTFSQLISNAAKETSKMFEPSKVYEEWNSFVEQVASRP